jgi:eukaryotic-like serine/threonine-protein kinase
MKAVALESLQRPASLHVEGELVDGKYRLERELGAGAMGRVWLARNAMLDLPVAIKIVDAQQHGRDAMARVLSEARLLAQLSHPNIVRVLDCHSDKGAAYVVMELLEGCTLAELMEEGPLPAALVVRMAIPLLDALAAAHRAGIVHRDIKPENIYVAQRGNRICPKLLDFGIAHSPELPRTRKDKRLIVGTPGYMSPEQALGEEHVDARSDIWAIGVVMYEAISGESAFHSSNYTNYVRALRERKLIPLHGEGSVGLWMVLERAMSRAAEDRFGSAAEFAATLRLWLRARGLREDLKGDSLPEHWSVDGSVVHRAYCRSTTRAVAQREASERRRVMSGSAATLVDPRVPEHNGKWFDSWFSGAPSGLRSAVPVPPKKPLVFVAALATVLCATVAMLHARADAGSAGASKARRPGPLHAETAQHPPLSAADAAQLGVRSDATSSRKVEPTPPPAAALEATLVAPASPEAATAPKQPGVRRARHPRAARSGNAHATRTHEDKRRADASLGSMDLL